MILCTDVYSAAQCSTAQYRDAEREQEMVASGQTSRDQTDFKIQTINMKMSFLKKYLDYKTFFWS